jgi:hypothetical protein
LANACSKYSAATNRFTTMGEHRRLEGGHGMRTLRSPCRAVLRASRKKVCLAQ